MQLNDDLMFKAACLISNPPPYLPYNPSIVLFSTSKLSESITTMWVSPIYFNTYGLVFFITDERILTSNTPSNSIVFVPSSLQPLMLKRLVLAI
jgi:hypothetical protein